MAKETVRQLGDRASARIGSLGARRALALLGDVPRYRAALAALRNQAQTGPLVA
ncbi:MAG: hypothetical protein ACE5EV_06655 [Gaiellales bacterium]